MRVNLERLMEAYRKQYPVEAETVEVVAEVIDPAAYRDLDGRRLKGELEPHIRMARAKARRKAHRVMAILGVAQDLDWGMLMDSIEGLA